MLKISDEHTAAFEELNLEAATVQSKYVAFLAAIHDEQKALRVRSQALWTEVMTAHNLDGVWRYESGQLFPVSQAQQGLNSALGSTGDGQPPN